MRPWAENLHQVLQVRLTFLLTIQGSLVLQTKVNRFLLLQHQSLWLQAVGQLFLSLRQAWQLPMTLLLMIQGSLLLQLKVHWFQILSNQALWLQIT